MECKQMCLILSVLLLLVVLFTAKSEHFQKVTIQKGAMAGVAKAQAPKPAAKPAAARKPATQARRK